ncbi:MAG: MATE family efflux transporter [Bacteroidales bacterium]|nr:MATE family efflux transporter [Bacteroidales bacterium]MCF8404741.1 MATE family efflux transporter [Bacteroidales bacterium]
MIKKEKRYYKVLSDIKEAIAGTEQDFTKGSIKRAIFLLAVPMVLEMVMESIFALVDIYFVSRLGAEAIATVGITESLITVVYAIGVGLAMATTAMVSRRIGEKDKKGARRAAFQSIITGLFVSLFIAIPGMIFAKDLLRLMGAEEIIYTSMSSYTAIMLGGNAVIMLLFIINAVFRSAGDAAISFRVLVLANGLNIILDPILIFGLGPFPELGIMGAAIATNTGRGIAVIYQFYLLFRGNKRVQLTIENIRVHIATIRQLIKLSLGTISQYLIATSSWILLYRIISEFGSEALAGYTIAIRIIIFSLLPSWGISNAAATLVGQNLGAKQPERAEKSVWMVGKINVVLMGLISVILISFPQVFVSEFSKEPHVFSSAVLSLRVIAFGFAFYGLGMVLVQAINGAGDTLTPTKINFFSFWILEIPLAYLLALQFNVGESGVYFAIVIAESFMTLAALWFFKRGKWKKMEV